MKEWLIKGEKCLFPNDWNKNKIFKWVNDSSIKTCPICGKLDVLYDHFNKCNPAEQAAIRFNREMNNY